MVILWLEHCGIGLPFAETGSYVSEWFYDRCVAVLAAFHVSHDGVVVVTFRGEGYIDRCGGAHYT